MALADGSDAAVGDVIITRLVTDPHWRTLAAVLKDADARRLDVPAAITVALEDGALNPTAPAAELASRLHLLTYPEPFTLDPAGEGDETPHDDLHPRGPQDRDRSPITR